MTNTNLIVAELGTLSPSQYKVNDDFELARQNLLDILTSTNDTIANVLQLAEQSQNARFYEILTSLYKTAADCNSQLLDLQEKISKLNKQEGNKPTSVTNNLIMTTDEMRKLIFGDIKQLDAH